MRHTNTEGMLILKPGVIIILFPYLIIFYYKHL
jgi:hypothetical protein